MYLYKMIPFKGSIDLSTKFDLMPLFRCHYMWVCFSKSFSQTSLVHPDFKVLDLNIHVKHFMLFSLKAEK